MGFPLDERGWGVIELQAPAALEEELVAAAGPSCQGAEFRPAGAERGRLLLYFATPVDAAASRPTVVSALRRVGLEPGACGLAVARVVEVGSNTTRPGCFLSRSGAGS